MSIGVLGTIGWPCFSHQWGGSRGAVGQGAMRNFFNSLEGISRRGNSVSLCDSMPYFFLTER